MTFTTENKTAMRNLIAIHTEDYLAQGGKIIQHTSADNRGAEEDGSVLWKATRTRESNLAERKKKDTAIIESTIDRKNYLQRGKFNDDITVFQDEF